MSQIMSLLFITSNTIMFSLSNHPMTMGITLLMQTVFMCMMIGIMSYNSWFSYILFLVFLGGMLVLFIYMTSIASNELFNKTMYIPTIMLVFMFMMMMMMMMYDPFILNSSINDMYINNNNMMMMMSPLYNKPVSKITIFMVLYLFLTLIVIVYITNYQKGPLRPMN